MSNNPSYDPAREEAAMPMRTKAQTLAQRLAMQQVDALRGEVGALGTSIASMVEGMFQRFATELSSARREGQAALERQIRPALEDLRQAITLRDVELVEVLRSITASQEQIAQQLEADRLERRYLRDVLTVLAERVGTIDVRPTSSVIGGAVRPDGGRVLSLPSEERAELKRAVEVRCRFGDRWAEGFEIADVIEDERGRRYRLRRLSDGHIIPTSFEEHDIRIAVHER